MLVAGVNRQAGRMIAAESRRATLDARIRQLTL